MAGMESFTRELEARAEAEAARQRLAFLVEASDALAASLDYEVTLTAVTRLAVPCLADWCYVTVVEDDGSIRRLDVTHADATRAEAAEVLAHRYPLAPDAPGGAARVVREGRSELHPDIRDTSLQAIAQDDEHLRLLRAAHLTSSMIVPLVTRGRIIGAITIVSAESGRHYTPADLTLAEDLARRAALAVDNARLYHAAQEARRTAETAARLRDEFLSTVSHDLKNPLMSIKGHAQLLQRMVAVANTPEAERLARSVASINASIIRMTQLIGELLDIAQIQAGRHLTLDPRPTDLVALARQAVTDLQQTTARHHIDLDAPMPKLVCMIDAAHIERVLANLLANAIKYSPQGGDITVSLTYEDGAGAEGSDGAGCAVVLVRDHGMGIPPADLPHIFERFYRGSNVSRITGTGIGLAGAQQIMELHGGTIRAESHEGAGATVMLRLPTRPAG